jgi:putative endonuclease
MNHLLDAIKQLFGVLPAGSGDADAGDSMGAAGERLAVAELRKKRYKILGRGVRSPFGEIDIVARDGGTIVFVEVKTRNTTDPFDPLEAVTMAKQQQLTKLALAYLTKHRLLDKPSRFDVVAICWPGQGVPRVQHVRGAFEATGKGQMYT